jgi:elongation factor Ts
MAITASDVAKLRKITGAGMMDCKKALSEANGDFDKATDILREKGQKVASKRADREASEGVVLAKVTDDNKVGALIGLNCETDFVAKNEDFIKVADSIVNLSLEKKPADINELKSLTLDGKSIEETITFQTGVIGEKLELSYYEKLESEFVIPYIHPGNKLAALAGFNKSVDDIQVAKDVVMQIAAMDPVAIDKDDVPVETIEHELKIAKEQARQEGKPENMLDKIANGRLNKFYKESTLLNQQSVKDNKKSIKQVLQEVDKELTVTSFKRYSLRV